MSEEPQAGWSRNKALVILAAVTIALAIMSEVLTGAIEPASESLHLTPRFAGVFLLALVGNAAEILNAVRFARKDQMDLSIGVTAGASAQVGLLVAPVLVFLGMIMGQNMDLIFSPARTDRDRDGDLPDPKPDVRRRVKLAGRLDAHRRLLPVRNCVSAPPRDRAAQSADRPPGRRGAAVIAVASQVDHLGNRVCGLVSWDLRTTT